MHISVLVDEDLDISNQIFKNSSAPRCHERCVHRDCLARIKRLKAKRREVTPAPVLEEMSELDCIEWVAVFPTFESGLNGGQIEERMTTKENTTNGKVGGYLCKASGACKCRRTPINKVLIRN